jgi:hypothetical protein
MVLLSINIILYIVLITLLIYKQYNYVKLRRIYNDLKIKQTITTDFAEQLLIKRTKNTSAKQITSKLKKPTSKTK